MVFILRKGLEISIFEEITNQFILFILCDLFFKYKTYLPQWCCRRGCICLCVLCKFIKNILLIEPSPTERWSYLQHEQFHYWYIISLNEVFYVLRETETSVNCSVIIPLFDKGLIADAIMTKWCLLYPIRFGLFRYHTMICFIQWIRRQSSRVANIKTYSNF